MFQKIQLTAGQTVEFTEIGDFFRLLATDAPLDVVFFNSGRELYRAEDITEGYAEHSGMKPFDRLKIVSATDQNIQFVTRYGGSVEFNQTPTGAVEVVNTGGNFVQTNVAAGAASAEIIAANSLRRYLLIQNTDAANAVYVRFDGAAATAANGLVIPAGGSFVAEIFAPHGAVTAIAAAGAPNLIIIEG